MPITSDAKSELSKTIRSLRTRLLDDLHAATEGVYRLSLDAKDAKLGEAARIKRDRLESWIAEQIRALPEKEQVGAGERFRHEVEKEAASTLLNRIVFLRLLEASDLRAEKVVTGGWESRGYKDFREFAPELVRDDESEGYAQLLQLIFDDLAIDLPGLFGNVGLTALIPVPAATLRAVVEALDIADLESCWTDDMTLGWIYQYWNDPVREALDAKLNDGGKVEPHEIASKTQMFTERYMVDWLLQNSLGPIWLAMCKKNGWAPEVETDGTLERLEERRTEWRAKRDAEEVSLTELMPLETEAEQRWAYYVPQPIPDDAIEQANDSVRDLKILDPAVGSGHFLVVAFDLLIALYREEARHRGEEGGHQWSERSIVERILEHNLNGIDLDPRAVQIAAAALWLKAQQTCVEAQPRQLNLVASSLRLSYLPADDAARRELRMEVERETGIPAELTQRIVDALAGADHLGSLLKIDAAIEEAIAEREESLTRQDQAQGDFFNEDWKDRRISIDVEEAKATLIGRVEYFLHAHSHGDDLGLKLKGEQLAAGVRFVRLVQEGGYDLVVANPPYQGTSKMADSRYIEKHYSLGKTDLYAAFLLRGLQLVRTGGVSAMLTMRSWMFTKQYSSLRVFLLENADLRTIGDLSSGAFQEISAAQVVVSVSMAVFANDRPTTEQSIALKAFDDETLLKLGETERKRGALLCHIGRYDFDPQGLKVVQRWPLIYWWGANRLSLFNTHLNVAAACGVRQGIATGDDFRFTLRPFEVFLSDVFISRFSIHFDGVCPWVPLIMGAAGQSWQEPLSNILKWRWNGLEKKVNHEFFGSKGGNGAPSAQLYFKQGVAFATMGQKFSARIHRFASVFGVKGCSVFPPNNADCVCLLNTSRSKSILQDFNPGTDFTNGDVERLPLAGVDSSDEIFELLEDAFSRHESHRETSVEFKQPGPSPWIGAQAWAQRAVDRAHGEALPPYVEHLEPEPASHHLSFALGVGFGRFGSNGEGVIQSPVDKVPLNFPAGICFLDGTLEVNCLDDSLGHEAAAFLWTKWTDLHLSVDATSDLRTWLRTKYFSNVHKDMYENRPIYFPLSSEKKRFVAYVSIHSWSEGTLRFLLAEHLYPTLSRIDGELSDLRESRQSADKESLRDAERMYDYLTTCRQELDSFIAQVEQCSECGPPQPDSTTPGREVDARYAPNLADGVLINSAALWPLLDPQWKEPRKIWKELAIANPKGNKDYDWSHLSSLYFPKRVEKKCQTDPSLAVAHGCFWKYHAESAYKWELRLQDEIAPSFTIDEEGSDEARTAFEEEYPEKVEELVGAERKRREKNMKKQEKESASAGPLFDLSNEIDSARPAR